MASEPLVSCILLSMGKEREAMHERALRSYESQVYSNKELIVYEGPRTKTIGELRNLAIAQSHGSILVTWDQDDWSHASRISEQIALLQSSGADAVGFNECLFWDSRKDGNAWLYRNPIPHYALGTSLCIWRRAWEAHPFDAISHGEDARFIGKCRTVGVSSNRLEDGMGEEPRMVCSIHGSNTSPFDPATSPAMCRRVSEWDDYCRRVMALEVPCV